MPARQATQATEQAESGTTAAPAAPTAQPALTSDFQVRFEQDEGSIYALVRVSQAGRDLLDRQCTKLGLAQGACTRPFGHVVAEPIPFWKDTSAGRLANAIATNTQQRMRNRGDSGFHYVDDANAPLYEGDERQGTVNVAILRFKVQPGETLRLKVMTGTMGAQQMTRALRGVASAFQAIASIVLSAQVDVTIRAE